MFNKFTPLVLVALAAAIWWVSSRESPSYQDDAREVCSRYLPGDSTTLAPLSWRRDLNIMYIDCDKVRAWREEP